MNKRIHIILLFLISNFCFSQWVTQTFDYTGSPVLFTVPEGVCEITYVVDGAQGGGGNAGKGARVNGTLAVTPGQQLQLNVGGRGALAGAGFGAPAGGGWNGGGHGRQGLDIYFPWPFNFIVFINSSGGGGGASDIRAGGFSSTDRVVVAAGGAGQGGGGYKRAGGNGGCTNGFDGIGGSAILGTGGGRGATQTVGGTGGSGGFLSGILALSGENGSLAQGGRGAPDTLFNFSPGSGGGGGLYGGGGGGSENINVSNFLAQYGGGSGGGGSSLTPAGASCSAGVVNGNGKITFTYFVNRPTFTSLPDVLCANSNYSLPTTSEEGMNGTWTPAFNNTTTQTYTFTPDPIFCAARHFKTITITPLPSATITNNSPACENDDAIFQIQSDPGNIITYTINNGATQTITIPDSGVYTLTLNNITTNQNLSVVSVSNGNCVSNSTLNSSVESTVVITSDIDY